MLQIDNYIAVTSLNEAYETLVTVPGSVILGGCGYLRLGSRKIATAIDLSGLGLDQITQVNDRVEIGAMATLRSIETHPISSSLGHGVLASALAHIVGVQFRNCVTMGGTVGGRYPFSDPLTALLALDTSVHLHHQGIMPLEDFLAAPGIRDVVVKLSIPADGRLAAFTCLRRSATDFSLLNVAVAQSDTDFRVVVGSRPGRAKRARNTESYLKENGLNPHTAHQAGSLATEELSFSDNARASGDYRRALCPVLLRRALTEVLHAD